MGTEKGVKLDNGKIRLGLVLGGFAKGLKRSVVLALLGQINIVITAGRLLIMG